MILLGTATAAGAAASAGAVTAPAGALPSSQKLTPILLQPSGALPSQTPRSSSAVISPADLAFEADTTDVLDSNGDEIVADGPFGGGYVNDSQTHKYRHTPSPIDLLPGQFEVASSNCSALANGAQR